MPQLIAAGRVADTYQAARYGVRYLPAPTSRPSRFFSRSGKAHPTRSPTPSGTSPVASSPTFFPSSPERRATDRPRPCDGPGHSRVTEADSPSRSGCVDLQAGWNGEDLDPAGCRQAQVEWLARHSQPAHRQLTHR